MQIIRIFKNKGVPSRRRQLLGGLLGGGIALSVMAASVGQAVAQGADVNTDLEEIVVTGIRGSLQKSLVAKRNAAGIIDAVTAEDIGKFPDENVAEALQRIPGVSITRERGEGKLISVRGLAPRFSPVTINGRTISSRAGSSNFDFGGGSGGSTRAFAFDVLPSELIGGIEVHKTLTADLIEGGIGGLVNIQTRRPLDLEDGLTLSGSAQAVYRPEGDSVKPRVSFLVGDKFADDTIGVILSGSYSERSLREKQFWSWGWHQQGVDDLGTPPPSGSEFGRADNPAEADYPDAWYPFEDAALPIQFDSQRIGTAGSIQYRPNDRFELIVDGLYTQYEADTAQNRGAVRWTRDGLPGTNPRLTDPDENGNRKIKSNNSPFGIYNSVVDPDTGRLISGSSLGPNGETQVFEFATNDERYDVITDTIAVGVNTTYQADGWRIAGDISYSEAETKDRSFSARFKGDFDWTYDFSDPGNHIPTYTAHGDLTNPDNFTILDSSVGNNLVEDSDLSARLDFTYDLHTWGFTSIDAGIRYNGRENSQKEFECDASVCRLDELRPGLSLADTHYSLSEGFFDGSEAGSLRSFVHPDAPAVFAQLGVDPQDASVPKNLSTYTIEEDTYAVYMRANFEIDGYGPISGNLGVRIIKTDSAATGASPERIRIEDNKLLESVGTFSTFDRSYTYVLPSLNLKVDLSDDLVARVGIGRSLSRPELSKLAPRLSFDLAKPPNASDGNPDLDPFVAWNYDLSIEWYFNRNTLLSAALFYKDVGGFVFDKTTANQTIAGQLFAFVTKPDNAAAAGIRGIELIYQQSYDFLPAPFDGFGTQFNYTYIDSSTEFTEDGFDSSGFVSNDFEGLSRYTANFVIYYEKGPFSVRTAYNYRTDYVENTNLIFSARSVRDYGQLDMSASYNITDKIALVLEGVAINKPLLEKFDGTIEDLRSVVIQNDSRWFLGIRATL